MKSINCTLYTKDKRLLIKIFSLLFLFLIVFWSCSKVTAYANDDREALKEKLEQQEEELNDVIEPYDPTKDKNVTDTINNSVKAFEENKSTEGIFDVKGKIAAMQKGIINLVVKTRTYAIILYGAIWILGVIYYAVMGSRDVNKRRKVFLVIRNATVLFFVYINIPILLIWLNTDKSQLTRLTFFNVIFSVLGFLQRNSVVISCLLFYAGVTRLIISRNDLPVRKQGMFLMKASPLVLLLLNIVPFAMNFIV